MNVDRVIINVENLNEDFLIQNLNQITSTKLDLILRKKKFSEDFLNLIKDKISNWATLIEYQSLSENFMQENLDKMRWYYVCKFQKLSESFMKKNSHFLKWDYVSKFQIFSYNFAVENIEKISIEYLDLNEKINKREFKEKGFYEARKLLKSS